MAADGTGGATPSPGRPDNRALLRWTGTERVFEGGRIGADGAPGPEIVVDSGGINGPSPMDALLLSLAGCMAIDVLMILEKGRVPVDAMEVAVDGHRREEPPRYFTRLRLEYRLTGPGEEHEPRLERAVALSREKYCSVLHSLRPDLDLVIEVRRT